MAINNHQTFIGNLTADPELRSTEGGKEVCSFSIGVNRGYGEKRRAIFPRCVAFGQKAVYISKQRKGTLLAVSGEYDIREYERNGAKQQSHEFTVLDVQVLQKSGAEAHEMQEAATDAPAFANGYATPNFETIGKDDDLPF